MSGLMGRYSSSGGGCETRNESLIRDDETYACLYTVVCN